jgi:hypothetical protein
MRQRWFDCVDVEIHDDDGQLVYSGPKFLRCMADECGQLVTHGMLAEYGSCSCGFRRVRPATVITRDEKSGLLNGKYLLNEWETICMGNDDI